MSTATGLKMTEQKFQVTVTKGEWPGDAPFSLKVEEGVSTFAAVLALMNSILAMQTAATNGQCDPEMSIKITDVKHILELGSRINQLADDIASGETEWLLTRPE